MDVVKLPKKVRMVCYEIMDRETSQESPYGLL